MLIPRLAFKTGLKKGGTENLPPSESKCPSGPDAQQLTRGVYVIHVNRRNRSHSFYLCVLGELRERNVLKMSSPHAGGLICVLVHETGIAVSPLSLSETSFYYEMKERNVLIWNRLALLACSPQIHTKTSFFFFHF